MRRAAWMAMIAGAGMVVAGAQSAQAQKAVPVAMESLAQAYLQDGPDCAKAAATYDHAAAARPADDPQAVEDFRLAGLLYAQAGDLRSAGKAMDKAGRRALAQGDFAAAAEAYTLATYIAAKAHDSQAPVLAHRALWLANQPGVTDTQRALIRQRVTPVVLAYTVN